MHLVWNLVQQTDDDSSGAKKNAYSWEVASSVLFQYTEQFWTFYRKTNLMSLTKALESEEPGKNFEQQTTYDRFQLPTGVRRALFERDCKKIPRWENQLWFCSDIDFGVLSRNSLRFESNSRSVSAIAIQDATSGG